MNRRTFFSRLLRSLLALPIVALAAPYVFPEKFDKRKRVNKILLGVSDELFASKNFFRSSVGNTEAIVFKLTDGYQAFSLRCTHAECTVHYSADEQLFVCPCHGGEFNKDGSVKKSPPQKPLERLFVSEREGLVYLSDRVIS